MAETNPTPRTGIRWGRILLIASLALNLIVIGLVVGAMVRFGGKGHDGGPRAIDRMSMGLGAYVQALPNDARARVAEAGGGFSREDRRARFDRLRQSHAGVIAALEAEPFDADALRAALVAHRDSAFGSTLAVQEAFVAEVAALSPEDRKALLARAHEMRRSWKSRKGGDRD